MMLRHSAWDFHAILYVLFHISLLRNNGVSLFPITGDTATDEKNLTMKHVMTTLQNKFRQHECELFHYNRLALILWITASTCCFLALISTIYTVFNAYQLWSTIQDLENAIIDLIDEACQILLPIGICKQICHPHHIGTVNANYGGKGEHKDVKPGTKDNRYPEDVTFPPSDIEKVYDIMGDEDARKSKTLTLVSLEDGSIDEKPPKESEKEKKKPPITPAPAPRTPTNMMKQPSREILLTPKQSLKTANEGTRKTQSMETVEMAKRSMSREQMSGSGGFGGGSAGKRQSREGVMEERKQPVLPSREPNGPAQFSGGERKTPSRERESSKKTNGPPKMGTAEPI